MTSRASLPLASAYFTHAVDIDDVLRDVGEHLGRVESVLSGVTERRIPADRHAVVLRR